MGVLFKVERLVSEDKTLYAMAKIYCDHEHPQVEKNAHGICVDCEELVAFTLERTAACPYGHERNCEDCDIKCQRGSKQEGIKKLMRYAAPRMLFRHPIMTFDYLRLKKK